MPGPLAAAASARLIRYPDGVTAVDAEYAYPGHAAVHIVTDAGHAAIVDPCANDSIPVVLRALDELGIPREAVDYVLLTHVHLDHAGGAGLLMRELPNATALVHPRGRPHLLDPAKLVAGTVKVYGEERFRQLYGTVLPIDAARLRSVSEGERIALGRRELEVLDTPGHALHHCVYVDRAHACIFAGDTFGISYREFDTAAGAFIFPTTTPPQFDPDQAIDSVRRLVACTPASIYLMHFARVTDIPQLGESLVTQLAEFARIAERHADAPDRARLMRTDMRELWVRLAQAHGLGFDAAQVEEHFAADLDLNTQGLVAWVARRRRAA